MKKIGCVQHDCASCRATPVPTPYRVSPPGDSENYDREHWEIHDGFGRTATVWGDPNDPETKATVAFIVRACNHHEALVEALRAAAHFIEDVPPDAPDRTERFFEVRAKWREAFSVASPK